MGPKTMAAAALCAALAAFGLAACQAQETSPDPGREEAPAREPEAPEGAAAPAPEEAAGERGSGEGQGWTVIPEGYDPDADEWPGASLGFIGPNGEGAADTDGSHYATNEEYQRALSAHDPVENEVEARVERSREGYRSYQGGVLNLILDPSFSEYDAHVLVEGMGGVWLRDGYGGFGGAGDILDASVYFPQALSEEELKEVAASLEQSDGVRAAGIPYTYDGTDDDYDGDGSAASSPYSSQPYLALSRFTDAWSVVKCSGDATIAVVDHGFDLDHPDLSDNLLGCWDAIGSKLVAADPYPGDHGTSVSGVASARAGNAVGIAGCSYDAEIMPVLRTGADGQDGPEGAYKALKYLSECPVKPDVVNMSFGWYRSRLDDVEQMYLDAMGFRIEKLRAAGVVLVATAGNDSTGELRYPASFDGVVSVSSVTGSKALSAFSNFGEAVDICAMGTDVYTTTNPDVRAGGDAYGTVSGTSFAAPQVAAAAALLKAQHPPWTPAQVEGRLESTAADLGDAGRDDLYGHGLLNAAAAVGWEAPPAQTNRPENEVPEKVPVDTNRNSPVCRFDSCYKPVAALPTDGYVTGAATRDAMPALEMLGLASVEESGWGWRPEIG